MKLQARTQITTIEQRCYNKQCFSGFTDRSNSS